MLFDLKYAVRQLVKSPGFSLFAILTLALGIGANTAIFTAINQVFLSSLPVKDPQQLVFLTDPHMRGRGTGERTGARGLLTYPEFQYLREHNEVFSSMFAASSYEPRLDVTVNGAAQREKISAAAISSVSGNYFSVLGVKAILGRTFTAEVDKTPGANPVAVISYRTWQDHFQGNSNVLSAKLLINDTLFEIVGVAPPGFSGETVGESPAVWVPLSMQLAISPGSNGLTEEKNPLFKTFWIQAIGRLKPAATMSQAKTGINVTFQQYLRAQSTELAASDKKGFLDQQIALARASHGGSTLGNESEPLILLMTLVGLLLLIACANLGALLLARATFRQREIAVRLAIGAKPSRIFRQLLTESLLLALLGGAAGVILARWADVFLQRLFMPAVPLSLTPRVLFFALGVSIVVGVAFGVAPIFSAIRLDVNSALKGTVGGPARLGRVSFGSILIVAQVSFSILLLIVAGLFVHSFQRLAAVEPGFDHDHLLVFWVSPIESGYKNAALPSLYQTLIDQVGAVPGVRAVTLSEEGLFSGSYGNDPISIDGYTPKSGQDMDANYDHVGPCYFSTLGVPIVLGREIGPQDEGDGQRVCVINRTMARYYFGDANPLGRRIRDAFEPANGANFIVVGVAADSKYNNLREKAVPRFFVPINHPIYPLSWATVEVRTAGKPSSVAAAIAAKMKKIDPNLKASDPRPMNRIFDDTLSVDGLLIKFSSCFGVLAAILASIGIYGVMSYAVVRRTREIGIRIALGAQRGSLLRLILGESLLLVLIGVALGVPAGIGAEKLCANLLFGLHAADPAALVAAVVLMFLVAAAAGYFPARRAAGVNPLVALRTE